MRRIVTILALGFLAASGGVASSAFAAKVPTTLKQRVQACTACHGEQGGGGLQNFYPRLGGQHQGYLFRQLKEFREGMRAFPVMQYMANRLSDAYLREIAGYFSQQNPPYPPVTRNAFDPALIAMGRQLTTKGNWRTGVPACEVCHGPDLQGTAPYIPNLLGQPIAYIDAQLGGWAAGTRGPKGDVMRWIASDLSQENIRALDAYLATLRPKGEAHVSLLKPGYVQPRPPVESRVYEFPNGAWGQ